MKVIYVDIDETICDTPTDPTDGSRDYYASVPRLDMIEKINKIYDEGNTVVYWTARGSRSGIDWHDHTEKQLVEWGAKHHQLRCDKPFYDMFYDDKTMRIEEI